jgi:hypothetical protein
MTARFWIVVSDQRGPSTWPHRHMVEEFAFSEAQRLAALNPGTRFFVMAAIGASESNNVKTVRYTDNDEIPF